MALKRSLLTHPLLYMHKDNSMQITKIQDASLLMINPWKHILQKNIYMLKPNVNNKRCQLTNPIYI